MKKVKLALITDASARRAAYYKRKKGLLKKVSELSILCGISVCAVVYGPYKQRPEVWPSQSEAHSVLMKFKSLPKMLKSKKMMDQEMFLSERIMKLREKLKKQQKVNRYNEITNLMSQTLVAGKTSLQDVGFHDLSDLAWLIEEKSREVRDRLEALNKQTATAAAAAANTNITTTVVQTNSTTNFNNGTGGINMNIEGGGGGDLLLQVGMNMNGTGDEQVAAEKAVVDPMQAVVDPNGTGDEQAATEKAVVDPMQAVVENLKRQNWFMPEVNMNMELNMNPTPTHHHDPMMGEYLGDGVGVLDHHHNPDQMQMRTGMEMGMASSSSTLYGGVADININNVAAAAAADWMASYNPFYPNSAIFSSF